MTFFCLVFGYSGRLVGDMDTCRFYINLVNFWLVRSPGVAKAPRGLNFSSISPGRQGLSIGVDLRRAVLLKKPEIH
jgi:hypothetical protein